MTPELRRLLELSAKAMGYEPQKVRECAVRGDYLQCSRGENITIGWQPHLDRLQSYNMECFLEISMEWTADGVDVVAMDESADQYIIRRVAFSDHDHDRAATRMMAALQVAAEIGRRIQE